MPNLLIRKGFSAGWQWREGERLLNLKDLPAVLQPGLKRHFENGPILKPLFLSRIGPECCHFRPERGRMWQKLTFFDTQFYEDGQASQRRDEVASWQVARETNLSACNRTLTVGSTCLPLR